MLDNMRSCTMFFDKLFFAESTLVSVKSVVDLRFVTLEAMIVNKAFWTGVAQVWQ